MARLPKHLTIENFHKPINMGMAMSSKIILDNLNMRYLSKVVNDVSITTYMRDNSYIFVLKIPSEKNKELIRNVYYDTIVEFYPITKVYEKTKTIKDYGLRVFSNCPTFLFGFTNLYHRINSLYDLPKDYYSKQALSDAANITNPMKLTGIEKSIYYSIKKIGELTNFNKSRIKVLANQNKLDINDVPNKLSSQDEKVAERSLIEKQSKEKIRIAKAKEAKKKKKVIVRKKAVKSKIDNVKTSFKSALNVKTNKNTFKSVLNKTKNKFQPVLKVTEKSTKKTFTSTLKKKSNKNTFKPSLGTKKSK